MRTLEDIKKDPRSTSRGIKAAIAALESGIDLESPQFAECVERAYDTGKHRSPSYIRGEIAQLRKFFLHNAKL